MLGLFLLTGSMLCACGGGSSADTGTTNPPPQTTTATPTISTAAAQNSAVIVTLADTTSGAKIYYTLDGSAPTTSSQIYQAPFLVASNMTVKAIAVASGNSNSTVASKDFAPNIGSGTLVWSDEFNGSGGKEQPNASNWTYDVGKNCCGNNEQETYCAWGSTTAPCDSNNPNAYVGSDGYLHITALNPSAGTYTSARLKTQGQFSFMYGRIEAKLKVPESQGMWPAFWMLGNNITTVSWPACGELDIMEHINGSNPMLNGSQPGYDWIAGSVHTGGDGSGIFHETAFSAADWHTYGMIWTKGQVQFYVDDPSNIYATFKSTDAQFANGKWPFDLGPQFIILNLAVGGTWPGNVDNTTVFPGNMLVDYVRIYTN